jgi:3'-phosphoadenosine 5'-phosphosulfate sulfotransferase (PAPS reductase)/FAD synthetase
VTGEESSDRAKYEDAEPHRTDSNRRVVHQRRPILDWKEKQVSDIVERWRVRPHPAYQLGWGRSSCLACIFGDEDQWASVNKLAPSGSAGLPIWSANSAPRSRKPQTVEEMARRGREFVSDKPEELRRLAMSPDAFTAELFFLPEGELWKSPAGACKRCGGPT